MELAEAAEKAPPPPSGRRERKKAETKRRIIDAASQLFWSKGYDATSVNDIADNLMARDQRVPQRRQFGVDDVQVGTADAAGADLE